MQTITIEHPSMQRFLIIIIVKPSLYLCLELHISADSANKQPSMLTEILAPVGVVVLLLVVAMVTVVTVVGVVCVKKQQKETNSYQKIGFYSASTSEDDED